MVQGIKFLSKKGFNPQNLSNQKRVWEVEQRAAEERKKTIDRQRQLERERDDEELARGRGETPRLSFLYDAPPGLLLSKNTTTSAAAEAKAEEDATKRAASTHPAATTTTTSFASTSCLTEVHPDDDEATAAFRKLLAGAAPPQHSAESALFDMATRTGTMAGKFGTVLQGTDYDAHHGGKKDGIEGASSSISNDKKMSAATDPSKNGGAAHATTALEKAVGGRRPTAALTLDEQIQRFPVLANAPRAKGMTATDIGVSFKPLGSQIRNVKCLACGVWGHSRGDRECRVSGWDPFATTATTITTKGASSATGAATKMAITVEVRPASSDMQVDRDRARRAGHDETSSSHRRRQHRGDDEDKDDDDDDYDGRKRKSKKRTRRHQHSDDESNSSSSSEDSLQRRRKRHKKKTKKHKDKKRH
jgi:CBF1 interacting corepressor